MAARTFALLAIVAMLLGLVLSSAAAGDKAVRGDATTATVEARAKPVAEETKAVRDQTATVPAGETAKLIMVTSLTRHGSRSPDKVLATLSCKPLLEKTHPGESLIDVFVKKFGTIPGELTQFGEDQMEEVGRFVKQRYGRLNLGFIDTENFFHRTTDWEFIARAGSRQQRSMMAIAQGLFPGTAVPIAVTDRISDAVLGGPAPQCGSITARMIVEWHASKGKALVNASYAQAVAPFEKICNVSLIDNPVNAAPGGPNPHAWIGDVSDLLDSMRENLPAAQQPDYSKESYDALTTLAFELEQRSHFDDPRGAVMFAGDFPNKLLKTFEGIVENDGKRPKKTPKFRMFACSRELEYGLSHMFKWENGIRLPDQPQGRVLPGSTIIWELWQIDGKYFIDTLMFQPGMKGTLELQPRTPLDDYKKEYENAVAVTGDWKTVCDVDRSSASTGNEEAHGLMFWAGLLFFFTVAAALAYRRGLKRSEYRQL